MTPPRILFLGGNGHAPVRLEGVRQVLQRRDTAFEISELVYPKAGTLEELLDRIETSVSHWHAEDPGALVYATGIGGLVALCLRARGSWLSHPLVIQGAVLWGLEGRWFPRLMRLPGMPNLLVRAFRMGPVRRRFQASHFRTARRPEWIERFFAGYADAQAFASWFDWLTPDLLRRLERSFAERPRALEGVEAWWGAEDTVVGLEELILTEKALGVRIPVREFPGWGHYPMIDDPGAWVAEVSRAVETAGSLS